MSTAHDEPAIRLEIFKDVFSKPAALCYLTESERRFVQEQFPERPLLEEVTGVGTSHPRQPVLPRMPAEAAVDAGDNNDDTCWRSPHSEEAPTAQRRWITRRGRRRRSPPHPQPRRQPAAGTGSTVRSRCMGI